MTSKVESKNFVQSHFSNENFRKYNVKIARKIGIEETILLYDLIDFFSYLEDNGKLTYIEGHKYPCFYYDHVKCEERTALKEKALFRLINSLKEKKLIKVVRKGSPQKRHIFINFSGVYKLNSEKPKIPKRELQNSQTGTSKLPNGNHYKKPNEKPKEKAQEEKDIGGKPPAPPVSVKKDSFPKIERAPHVHITEEEHQKLAEDHTEETRDKAYQILSDWKEDTPKAKWKKSDYRSILRWVIDSMKNKQNGGGGFAKKSRANPNLTPEQKAEYDRLF